MSPPFYPYHAGPPESFDSLEPADPVAWRETSIPTPEDQRDHERDGLVLSSDFSSLGFDPLVIESVWENGDRIAGNDAALWRKDQFGAWMYRHDYGKRRSEYGWEICDPGIGRDGGGLAALRPMQWQNYIDQVAALTRSRVTAEGLRNIRKLV